MAVFFRERSNYAKPGRRQPYNFLHAEKNAENLTLPAIAMQNSYKPHMAVLERFPMFHSANVTHGCKKGGEDVLTPLLLDRCPFPK